MKKRELWIFTKTVIKSMVLAFVWTNLVVTSIFVVPLEQAIFFVILPSFAFSIYLIYGIMLDYRPTWEDQINERSGNNERR